MYRESGSIRLVADEAISEKTGGNWGTTRPKGHRIVLRYKFASGDKRGRKEYKPKIFSIGKK